MRSGQRGRIERRSLFPLLFALRAWHQQSRIHPFGRATQGLVLTKNRSRAAGCVLSCLAAAPSASPRRLALRAHATRAANRHLPPASQVPPSAGRRALWDFSVPTPAPSPEGGVDRRTEKTGFQPVLSACGGLRAVGGYAAHLPCIRTHSPLARAALRRSAGCGDGWWVPLLPSHFAATVMFLPHHPSFITPG